MQIIDTTRDHIEVLRSATAIAVAMIQRGSDISMGADAVVDVAWYIAAGMYDRSREHTSKTVPFDRAKPPKGLNL